MKFGTIEATTISSEEDIDLSVLDFSETKRHPRGTSRIGATATKKPHRVTPRRGFGIMERETGFAGQRSWPCACDCVAANRRPSAWETEPRVRSDAYLQLLPCRGLQGAAQSGICDGSRLYPAPGFRGRGGRWSPRLLYSPPKRPPPPYLAAGPSGLPYTGFCSSEGLSYNLAPAAPGITSVRISRGSIRPCRS